MDCTATSHVFAIRQWTKTIPEQYLIETIVIDLTPSSLEFLLSDDTNPDLSLFPQRDQIQSAISALGGAVFIRLAERTGKDCSRLDRKVTGVFGLVMLIKMSEYITEALAEEEERAELVLRRYHGHFEDGIDQFRAYVLQGQLIGMCQKDPSFLGSHPTTNQLNTISCLKSDLEKALGPHLEKDYVFDVYCSPNGKQVRLFSIQPFHIHALSLFTEQELRRQIGKKGVLVRVVEEQSALKDMDLSEYRPGAQLKHLKNVHEWIQFMKKDQ